jgi:hypothetical protein
MELREVCDILVKLERENDVNDIELRGLKIWPLVRQHIWVELVWSAGSEQIAATRVRRTAEAYLRRAKEDLVARYRSGSEVDTSATMLFVSRPTNIQTLRGSGLGFDRIVDPLFFLAHNRARAQKFYVGTTDPAPALYLPAGNLAAPYPYWGAGLEGKAQQIGDLFVQAGLNRDKALASFAIKFAALRKWYDVGRATFGKSLDLKVLLVSAWAFPDTMGLIAAAKERGVTTIDVQHGKQGRYQGMYSWWTAIPPDGYQMLPDSFWCWGEASCAHILDSSPARSTHRPFVGGYPWPDFYRKFIGQGHAVDATQTAGTPSTRVLFTMQGRAGTHVEPIPEFFVDFLKSPGARETVIRFRCHPNATDGTSYCRQRLREVSASRFEISEGKTNLFDELLWATHHVTAFSSCGYEAELFGVPTLMFGEEARSIYAEEISTGRFTWTDGADEAFSSWLMREQPATTDTAAPGPRYVVSSIEKADEALQALLGDRSSLDRP